MSQGMRPVHEGINELSPYQMYLFCAPVKNKMSEREYNKWSAACDARAMKKMSDYQRSNERQKTYGFK